LVDELLDYIALKTSVPNEFKKEKISIHPLHVFSTKYTDPEYGFSPNYLLNTLAGKEVFVKKKSAPADTTDNNEIQLYEITNFFKHPVKYFFNKRLQVYYRDEEERLPETEIFELGSLHEWKIKDDFLKDDIELTEYIDRQKKQGNIPLANAGNVIVEELNHEMIPYKEKRNEIDRERYEEINDHIDP
jgi:exodeoxyribonuclease V gamma subunit